MNPVCALKECCRSPNCAWCGDKGSDAILGRLAGCVGSSELLSGKGGSCSTGSIVCLGITGTARAQPVACWRRKLQLTSCAWR